MDSKGLKELRGQLPFLEDFLCPTGGRPSVWNLKQYLDINDPKDHPPVLPVIIDYGFIDCDKDFEKICTLTEIYGEILKTADPLELHAACVAGNLFQFARRYFPMKEQWRPLMRNLYPLEKLE